MWFDLSFHYTHSHLFKSSLFSLFFFVVSLSLCMYLPQMQRGLWTWSVAVLLLLLLGDARAASSSLRSSSSNNQPPVSSDTWAAQSSLLFIISCSCSCRPKRRTLNWRFDHARQLAIQPCSTSGSMEKFGSPTLK